MNNLVKAIRKMTSGRSYVKCVQIFPTHGIENHEHPLYDKVEVHFHRKGGWTIFGYTKYKSHEYARKDVDKYVKWLNRCEDVDFKTVSASYRDYWFLQWFGRSHNRTIYVALLKVLGWSFYIPLWIYIVLKFAHLY